jgi:hypothetical protein
MHLYAPPHKVRHAEYTCDSKPEEMHTNGLEVRLCLCQCILARVRACGSHSAQALVNYTHGIGSHLIVNSYDVHITVLLRAGILGVSI